MSGEIIVHEMDEILQHEPTQRHSYFQLKYFLIGKEPTIQSKMWQCIRELKNRRDSMKSMDLELEEAHDKLLLLDIGIQRLQIAIKEKTSLAACAMNNLAIEEAAINVRQLDRQKKSLSESITQIRDRKKWVEEECRFFVETFKNLRKIEELKHFDDFESQKNYWNEKLTQKINMKMLTSGQIDSELVETVVALPDEVPVKKQTLQTLNNKQSQMLQQLSEITKKLESNSGHKES